jgi:uncharacterized protein
MAPAASKGGRMTALVTGASSGIGCDLARIFAQHGHDLVLVARREARLRALGEELKRSRGVQVTVLPADLSSPDAPERLAAGLLQRGIRVDLLVNNAGCGVYGPFDRTDLGAELAMIQINITSLTHLTKLLLPAMLARRQGRILNVASTAAFQPGPLMAVYYATKAYVLSFSEALANELLGSGVGVTALCPGPTRTEFQASAKIGSTRLVRGGLSMDSEAVARAGYKGLMSGRTLVIPGLKNRLLARSVSLLPRRAVTRVVRHFQEPLGS